MHEEARPDGTFQNHDDAITWMMVMLEYGAAVFLEYL